MVVADGFERREFAGERGFVADSVRHLEVAGASAFKCHEIDFSFVEHTYVDFAEPAVQLKVNDVFKQMSEVFAFRSEKGTAKPRVGDIVLRRGLEVFPQRRMPVTTLMTSLSSQLASQSVNHFLLILLLPHPSSRCVSPRGG